MNPAVTALTTRVSSPRLQAPAPSPEVMEQLFAAAARAADHGMLKPYRFLVVEGDESLAAMGKLYQESAKIEQPGLTAAEYDRMAVLPQRAPMIVVAIASPVEHPKVPALEQEFTAACAVQNMVNAAFALDVGAIWRTGAPSHFVGVKKGLGLTESESIVGFLYLGTPAAPLRELREQDKTVTVEKWPA